MSNEQSPAKSAKTPVAVEAASPTSFDLSLDEFCTRLSAKKVGPEMIGGFYHSEKAANKLKGSDAAFTADFDAFVKQPA